MFIDSKDLLLNLVKRLECQVAVVTSDLPRDDDLVRDD